MRIAKLVLIASVSALISAVSLLDAAAQPSGRDGTVQTATVTLLSTNLADAPGIGEWGLSALVEADGRCILFDTGRYPDTVEHNVDELGVDLSCVTDVVLSHHHADHTGGLTRLVERFGASGPDAFSRVHVPRGMFLERPNPDGTERNQMIGVRTQLESRGITFIEYDEATEIAPGVWVTGPIERTHPEKNYPTTPRVRVADELVEDFIPESQGLTLVTEDGHIVLLGCGHAGIVNALEHVQSHISQAPIHAAIGGFHLFDATDETLSWTATQLDTIGIGNIIGAHCTGIEALFHLRHEANLDRGTAVVGAVGGTFRLGEGIQPGRVAR